MERYNEKYEYYMDMPDKDKIKEMKESGYTEEEIEEYFKYERIIKQKMGRA